MITRAFLFGLIASVSLTSGCACCDCNHPCWGWRFHPCSSPCCSGPAPVAAPVVVPAPVVYRLPSGPDCPTCGGAPTAGFPAGFPSPGPGYPPVIGNPMPLPGGSIIPSPMPMGN